MSDSESKSDKEDSSTENKPTETDNDNSTSSQVKSKKEKKPGVIYLSRIPTKMNVKLIREYFSTFGEVDRIYLEPEEKKRKNQPRSFAEGWVEFKKKKIAKIVAKRLNNQQIGGKRRNPWYSELWNIKFLKNFQWTHLNERMAYEKELRKQRLRQEISLAKKESNFFVQNYDKYEKQKRLEKKKAAASGTNEEEKNGSETIEAAASANKNSNNDDDDADYPRLKHKRFERKVKVAGNDDFLRQIFS